MLPSTGYFKTINCPFYENGSCDRPYCHFKHARREDVGASAGVARVVETQAVGQNQGAKTSATAGPNSEMLQQLVSEAVKKVLADQEVTDTEGFSDTIVSKVVEGLKPTFTSNASASMETTSNVIGKHMNIPTPITKPVPCVYNPTPISELKKRHIPVVSYMPTRDTRIAVKRKTSPDSLKPWLNTTQESSSSKLTEITYKPTAIVNTTEQDSTRSYVPTFKSSSPSNSYDDSNSNENDYVPKVKEAYYPKSKKRREEYVPKKIKAPLKNVQCADGTDFDPFKSQYEVMDEMMSTSAATPNASANEESQDLCLDIEPKFSDDDTMSESPETSSRSNSDTLTETTDRDKENVQDIKSNEKLQNGKDDHKYSNHHKDKSDEKKINDKSEQKDSNKDKHSSHKERSKESSKGHEEKRSRSSSNSRDKERKNHSSSSKSSKERHKHKSSSSDRHRSSSHTDGKNKSKHSHSSRDSSHKHKEHSSSRKEKDSSSKNDKKEHHKSDKSDKHKTKTNPLEEKTGKHASDRNHRTHHSSNHRSSSSSKKSSKHKESSSEKALSDIEERPASPIERIPSFEDAVFLSDSDHDVEEECLKIFQEYQVSDQPKVVSVKESKAEVEENEETGRKRIAHPSAASSVTKTAAANQPPKKLPNPQQRMYERWRLMREAAAEKAAEKAGTAAKTHITANSAQPSSNNTHQVALEPPVALNSTEPQLNGNGRVRIAHVPYAMSLALKKKQVAETVAKTAENKVTESRTSAQTNKGGARVAHIPQAVPQLIRPEPLQSTTQKFPLNVRQYYINMMHDICVQIYTNSEDAAQRALREEFACYEKCKALPVYKNSCMLATHRLRKEVDQSKINDGSTPSPSGMVSHEAVLAGKSKGSWSVMKTKRATMNFKGSALYNMLVKWIMTEQQLRDNGFPRPHPDGPKGRAKVYVINSRNQTVLSKVPNERMCSRCGQAYMVDKNGLATRQQNCIYHWGRKFTIRGEGKYSCCQQYGSATGCCDAKSHVWDYTDYENLRGYVKTFPKDVPVEQQGVYALDCEMCYTTQGLELTRVTVINEDCNVIYETLVKPQNPIIDYNTRFSGITEENMKDVTTTLLDVQATLLMMFSEKTILVGHSLESDFKALRLLHETVVDTSVMFPHKNGLPQKRALKNLCSEYLRKIIQNDIGGHDSKEDAVACMELILWKVKEEAKLQ